MLTHLSTKTLRHPARYLPFLSGRYEVRTGLSNLGSDFGNSEADHRIFQIDDAWPRYRRDKLAARASCIDLYVCREGLGEEAEQRLVMYLRNQLCREYPAHFLMQTRNDHASLKCMLSDETLNFDEDFRLSGSDSAIKPAYSSALDALTCQVQEDLAFMDNGTPARLRWLHLCYPNHWAAQDKIGKDFAAIHEPVANIEKINTRAQTLMAALVQQGPYVRFAWGLTSDDQLNRHPMRAGGRGFTENGSLWIRIERQVTVPIPGHGFLFTIRTYMIDSATLDAREKRQLQQAVESMPPASKKYKGIAGFEDAILSALQDIQHQPLT